jgi:hypothetical protein
LSVCQFCPPDFLNEMETVGELDCLVERGSSRATAAHVDGRQAMHDRFNYGVIIRGLYTNSLSP